MSTIWNNRNPIILALLGTVLLRLSWQKWVNITLDYGRELYTPWRIACGQVLYKNIASLYGPFPPYWNALLFKVFGVSIMTLVLFNILLVIGITVLIYRFFSYTIDRRIALFVSAAFLSLIAFRQGNVFLDQGNFAYICPYSHSVTYALFFSLWAIDRFIAYVRSGRDVLLAAVGALIGLTALCRFEIFVFLGIALALGFISKGIIGRWPLGMFFKAGALALGGFCVPVSIAYLYFSTQLPLSQVAPSIFGFNDRWFEIFKVRYYQFTAGLDHPWHNFVIMMATATCYGVVIIAFKCLCAGADLAGKNDRRWQRVIFNLLGLAGIAQTGIWILCIPCDEIFRGLPVLIILMAGYLSLHLGRDQQDEEKAKHISALWTMAVWALLMLTKIFLNARVNSEGFVYALPSVMLFFAFFLDFVPKYFERTYPRLHFIKTLASALVLFIFLTGLGSTIYNYQLRKFYIRSGPDVIICKNDPRYHPDAEIGEIAAFLKNADKIMGKNANFVVVPEGIMLNFLTKRASPVPYIDFHSAELVKYGEERMLRSFQKHKPDYIVLTSQFLPAKYPYAIKRWVLANYYPVWPAHPEISDMLTVYKCSR